MPTQCRLRGPRRLPSVSHATVRWGSPPGTPRRRWGGKKTEVSRPRNGSFPASCKIAMRFLGLIFLRVIHVKKGQNRITRKGMRPAPLRSPACLVSGKVPGYVGPSQIKKLWSSPVGCPSQLNSTERGNLVSCVDDELTTQARHCWPPPHGPTDALRVRGGRASSKAAAQVRTLHWASSCLP